MKHFVLLSLTALLLMTGASCNNKQLISDNAYRAQVEKDFEDKKAMLPNGDLFTIFDTPNLTTEEKEALMFLYAYMPAADIINNDGSLFLKHVRSSLQTRTEMEWGERIPETIFRHFVLPIRVNNEDLDSARMVFHDILTERIKGLSLREAVLEINHWCHEHVVYTPTDGRTISPLNIMKTAWGRCGEESTFTVTALRSVGIPARQIYTPRWAHTDSNHAWVEAWVDGEWYFFGACEPEPVLNLGWFNGPAYRAMLLHTRVFGKYNGPEEVMVRTANFTEINLMPNYAPTAKGTVKVVDATGQSVEGATVEFMIYNSTNFSSVLTEQTDADGQCSLTAGKGDLFIWVYKSDKVGYGKLSFGKDEVITVVLDKTPSQLSGFDIDIVPPVEGLVPTAEEVTPQMREENDRRMAEEDIIRGAYTATFLNRETAKAEAETLGIEGEIVIGHLVASRGNWKEIVTFLKDIDGARKKTAVEFLGVISRKDLQDTPASILKAHWEESLNTDSSLFVNYILNPRVGSERLTAYKKTLQEAFNKDFIVEARQNPALLVEWCQKELTIIDELNPQRIMTSPTGVLKARVCDAGSREIFFVALCRSLGIPARIEPVARRVQYFAGEWHNADLDGAREINLPQGTVTASFTHPTRFIPDPQYGNHFTLSVINNDGKLQGRNYRGQGRYWSQLLMNPLKMDAGYTYMLLSGTRMASGSVLARVEFFTVEEGKNVQTDLVIRESADDVQVVGSMDPEALYQPEGGKPAKSILATTGRGYFILGILGARQEPTNHAMNDITHVANQLNEWGRSIVLLFPSEQGLQQFDAAEFKGLPDNITYGIDISNVAATLARSLNLRNASTLPIFVIADSFGRIVFVSQGYTIGVGEQMLKVIQKL
ncbi:MAG: transglutaminase domain-containing protein [Tannerellaceae bacterium]|jgi:transglutaminase-like putative cysteine protease|nr:transglutaminase domain-containing protein [Tannerellaceae bacterium]